MKIEHLAIWVLDLERMRSFICNILIPAQVKNILIAKAGSRRILFFSEKIKHDWN
jgi:hypothetical protein